MTFAKHSVTLQQTKQTIYYSTIQIQKHTHIFHDYSLLHGCIFSQNFSENPTNLIFY